MTDSPPRTSSTTHGQALPPYEQYVSDTGILSRVKNINRFVFSIYYQKSGAISTISAREALLNDGYAVLNDLLEKSGIHYLHELEGKASLKSDTEKTGSETNEPLVEFVLNHDTKHCRFQFFDDRFSIYRQSSSFEDFYEWYSIVMPQALRIEMTLRQIIERATNRHLRPVQSVFEFAFDFSNFRVPDDLKKLRGPTREARNMDVLEGIIPQLPGPERAMRKLTEQQFYRLDLTISKREDFGNVSRNTWYYLEAPFNEKGRFIVFTAQLRNVSAQLLDEFDVIGTGAFDPDFSNDYRLALLDFLRNRAMEGFIWQLLKDWKFETERHL